MAERLDRRSDEQLERALRALGAELAYPPTPDLAAVVRARLAAGRPVRRSPLPGWLAAPLTRRLALALAVLIALIGAALALSPGARKAVAGRLGIPGITIVYVEPTATMPPTVARPTFPASTPVSSAAPTATATVRPTPASIGERLRLGRRVTLAEARARVAFPVLTPSLASLGEPDEVYLGEPPTGGQVSLVWLPRPDLPQAADTGVALLATQLRGDLDPGFFKKIIGGKTTVEFVTVDGAEGYWIAGDPHEFLYTDGRGTYVESTRLAGNVLLWERGGVTYRIEGPRTREEALRIASSMR